VLNLLFVAVSGVSVTETESGGDMGQDNTARWECCT